MSNKQFTSRVETWNVQGYKAGKHKYSRALILKVAVRDSNGRFHGATNFRGTNATVAGASATSR